MMTNLSGQSFICFKLNKCLQTFSHPLQLQNSAALTPFNPPPPLPTTPNPMEFADTWDGR